MSRALPWMIGLGFLTLLLTTPVLRQWEVLAPRSRWYIGVAVAAAVLLLAASALVGWTRWRPGAVLGLLAALALGINQVAGLYYRSIVCSAPG